jgi:tetratricopeptide (TPR) repeat protein
LNEAAQCCRQALAINPRLVDAHSNLGNLMKAQGFIQDAYSCYIEALRIDPHFAIAWSNLAGLFMEAGDLDKALMYYKEAVKLKPSFADAYLNQGNVYKVSLYVVIENPARECRDNFGLGGKLDLIFSWLSRLWECLKMPLCVINVHCRHALTMLWLMILISGEMRTSLQENGPFFTFKVEP